MKRPLLILLFVVGLAAKAQDSARNIHANNTRYFKLYPVLWQQNAAEYRALCYQAFNMAKLRLNELPKRVLKKKNLAIITDLDETIIDNSYSEAQLISVANEYNNLSWKNWIDKAAATAVPGAVDFLKYASQKQIEIFYISNRDTADLASTLINIQKLQLPNADVEHLYFTLTHLPKK